MAEVLKIFSASVTFVYSLGLTFVLIHPNT